MLSPSYIADVVLRLQQIVVGWHGAERGQPLTVLHNECLNAAGPGGRHLLPAHLLLVPNLDETNLRLALQKANGKCRGVTVRFRFKVAGRFDSVLVPLGPVGEPPEHWLLALEEGLPIREQIALYGHALGHLLLNREQVQLGQLPPLDPHEGFAHRDMLAELRRFEAVCQRSDRRVLETYAQLTALLEEREEPLTTLDTVTSDLRQRLAQDGWRGSLVELPYIFTQGRVFILAASTQHRRKLRVDALLRAEASLPIAVVQTIHAGQVHEEVLSRLQEYAHQRLAVPFAYLWEEDGTFLELDWTTSDEPAQTVLSALPSRDALLNRWLTALGLNNSLARDTLTFPYQLSGPKPWYYQEAATNRAVIAVLQAKRQLRPPRILLTLATGTGKTKVAFQLIWKLKRSRAVRNILFLTDRDYLLSQAMDNEFAPFGDARTRILGEATTSRDIVFATYQAMSDTKERAGLYHNFPRDFFDVIVVDECHRGSAQADSTWRTILTHFASAVQIGLTATPLSNETVQTDEYFGKSLYTYSLRTGINDGFLAPYRVHYILMGPKQEQEPASGDQPAQSSERTASPVPSEEEAFDPEVGVLGRELLEETAATMVARTTIIAQHLAAYLLRTDPLAKTIVFCVDQAHAEDMRRALEQACAVYTTRYPGYIERIVSDEGIEGKRALGRFSTPEERTLVIVTTSRLLTTGIDIPTCKNVVLARPVSSLVEFKQIIGRGSRLYEPLKTWFTIIDYTRAIKLFFDPSFDGDPELVEVEPLVPQLPQAGNEARNEPGSASTISVTTIPAASEVTLPYGGDDSTVKRSRFLTPERGREPAAASASVEASPDSVAMLPVVGDDTTQLPSGESSIPSSSSPVSPASSGEAGSTLQIRAEEPALSPPEVSPVAPSSLAVSGSLAPVPAPTLVTESLTVVKQTRSGQTISVIGEYVYDLAPDGKTLRRRSSYRDFAATALHELIGTPADLRARWLHKEQRAALRDALEEEGVDLAALAEALHLSGVDALDLLLHVAFGQPPLTRHERVKTLYREHGDFFNCYKPEACNILHIVLAKYETGEAQDVSDAELLKVPPLSERGTFVELAKAFGGGASVRAALKELQALLYSA